MDEDGNVQDQGQGQVRAMRRAPLINNMHVLNEERSFDPSTTHRSAKGTMDVFRIHGLVCYNRDDDFHCRARFVPSDSLTGCKLHRMSLEFTWRDQGWGNRKGKIALRIGEDALFVYEHVAPHEFETTEWVVPVPVDVHAGGSAAPIELHLKSGGGGGHRLSLSAVTFVVEYDNKYARRKDLLHLILLIRADRARLASLEEYVRSHAAAVALSADRVSFDIPRFLLNIRVGKQGEAALRAIDEYALGMSIQQVATLADDVLHYIFTFL